MPLIVLYKRNRQKLKFKTGRGGKKSLKEMFKKILKEQHQISIFDSDQSSG